MLFLFCKKSKINFAITRKNRIFAPRIQKINKRNQEKMTKADIIEEIMGRTGVPRREATAVVEAFMESVKSSLLDKKENVYLRGFGSFIVKHRAEKTARNISKNTTLVIAAHDFPSFKPAKSFVAKMKGEE